MALSSQDLDAIRTLLGRSPSTVELSIFDTMWSEHCSYKSSKEILKKYLPTQGSEVALGIGEDSGIIRFCKHEGKQYCIAISHESHNHPSQILPVEGAATGVGGVVRDVYCMGADVVGVLNSLHFGINDGKSPLVDDIAQNVVLGVSDYANPLGVPVLGGETLYHPSYNDNCLVNVAALGLIEESQIIRSRVPQEALTEPYDMILFGKSTDATGYGGASFSSATLDKENEAVNMGAVQVHDPFLKRVIVEAIKSLIKVVHQEQVSIGFKDLGAGGISCATSELASAGGFGVEIDLDKVNVAFDHLPPEVIACSETQERFCLAVPKSFSQTVLDIFNNQFALPQLYPHSGAVVIGHITQEKNYRLMSKGICLCDLPIQAITTEVKAHRTTLSRTILKTETLSSPVLSHEIIHTLCTHLLRLENICSKRYIYRFFDNAVRGDTIIYPGEGDAVVTTPIEGCPVGLTASIDSNLYGFIDPYVSGAAAVAEGVRNVISAGGKPIAVTDCLNYGNPENPASFFDFEEGVKGIADASKALGFIEGEPLPVISGNVSFYNDSKQGNAVVPSPVIVVVGKVENYQKALTMQIRQPYQTLILIGKRYAEFGGTQLDTMLLWGRKVAPQVRFSEEAAQNKAVFTCIQEGLLSACHDISMGGLWTTLTEMLLGERGVFRVGAELKIASSIDLPTLLFSENGGYLLSVSSNTLNQVKNTLTQFGVYVMELGQTIPEQTLSIFHKEKSLDWNLASLKKEWNSKNS